VTSR
jgi:hypothetical protein